MNWPTRKPGWQKSEKRKPLWKRKPDFPGKNRKRITTTTTIPRYRQRAKLNTTKNRKTSRQGPAQFYRPGIQDNDEFRQSVYSGIQFPGRSRFQEPYCLAAEVTNQVADSQHLPVMMEKTKENTGRYPKELSADAGYFSEENLKWVLMSIKI